MIVTPFIFNKTTKGELWELVLEGMGHEVATHQTINEQQEASGEEKPQWMTPRELLVSLS